jgi:hypothetical protein
MINSEGSVLLEDCQVVSKNTIMYAGKEFRDLGSLHETDNFKVVSKGPITFGASRQIYEREVSGDTHKEKDFMDIAKVTRLIAKKAHFETLGASDIVFEGTQMDVPKGEMTVKLNGGRVHFKAAKSQLYTYRFDDDSDLLTTDVEQTMRQDTTYVMPRIPEGIQFEGVSRILIDKIEQAALKSGSKGYYTNEMLAMMKEYNVSADESQLLDGFKDLPDDIKDKVEFQLAKEVHEYKHIHVTGPGPALIGAIAIITSIATMGCGASLASSMGYTVAMGSAKAAMINAAFCAFASHAAVSVATCDGDLGRALKNAFSDKAAKNIIMAALTAGICHQLLGQLGLDPNAVETAREGQTHLDTAATTTQAARDAAINTQGMFHNTHDFIKALAEQGVRSMASAFLHSATGDNSVWHNFIRTWAANTLGQWGAGEIGDLVNISPEAKTFFHGMLGGTTGGLMGGPGCFVSGAAGAMVGETLCHKMIQSGVSPDEAARIARIMGTLSGIPFGGNPNVAHATATNTVTYNCVPHALPLLLLAEGALIVGGAIVANPELVQQVMRYLGINIVGNGYTVGERTFTTIKDAAIFVVQNSTIRPIISTAQAFLEKIQDGPGQPSDPVAPHVRGAQPAASSGGALPPEDPDEQDRQAMREREDRARREREEDNPIVRDRRTGKIKSVKGTQKHHIISDKIKETRDHPLWELAGMDPDDAVNRILLPTKKGAENIWTTSQRSLHQGRHQKIVSENLTRKMQDAVDEVRRVNGSREQYAAELRKIIQEEAQALKNGERMLNRHHRPHAVPLPGQQVRRL